MLARPCPGKTRGGPMVRRFGTGAGALLRAFELTWVCGPDEIAVNERRLAVERTRRGVQEAGREPWLGAGDAKQQGRDADPEDPAENVVVLLSRSRAQDARPALVERPVEARRDV